MSNKEIQKFGRQDLIECASFWRNLIGELEIKNPDDVLPEMREALAASEARLCELNSSEI